MKLTATDERIRQQYEAAQPKQFGTLHERMKNVIRLVDDHDVPESLCTAIFDLQTEVSYHDPAVPPFGRRTQQI